MNGKGDKPRNCLSEEFRSNYGEIDWSRTTAPHQQDTQVNKDIVGSVGNPFDTYTGSENPPFIIISP